jgi:DNA transformation protein
MGHAYCDYLIDLLSPWAEVAVKSMFGGWGLYRKGQIFGIVIEDTPYFKVDDANRADYEAAGSEPFSYIAKGNKRVAMSYWQVPGDILDDGDTLKAWADKAYSAALASKVTKKKSKPRKTAKV